jgi:hypothetical protein
MTSTAELVRLSRTSIADEMRREHRRGACWPAKEHRTLSTRIELILERAERK